MSEITKEQLQKEISEILKDADLASMSTKNVREQLEKTFKCDLNSRRNEIREITMAIVNSKEDSNEEGDSSSESEEEEDEEEEEPKAKKRASNARKATPAKKKKKASSDEDDENSDADGQSDDKDSDYGAKPKKAAKGKQKGGRKKKGSDSDSDEDWKQQKKTKKAGPGKGKGKGTGFTRPYQLSTDLAQVVGAESLPRYEVVKKIWALIKERNLYDPKNKQYAICDNELLKVFGVKRFRTFSMLKYLKPHFID